MNAKADSHVQHMYMNWLVTVVIVLISIMIIGQILLHIATYDFQLQHFPN